MQFVDHWITNIASIELKEYVNVALEGVVIWLILSCNNNNIIYDNIFRTYDDPYDDPNNKSWLIMFMINYSLETIFEN